ncbi:MAG: glycosyltransferase family 39 protein [Anaerolineae bacterium]|nr:glycosyltransferase family 39 protein [Anaerolineae bacterium]
MKKYASLVLLLALCWLGFALRVCRLDAQPFWFDEWLSYDLARAPLFYAPATLDRPPLFYVLLHLWIKVAGTTPFAFRFFSVGCGALVAPLFYRLGRQALGRQAGVWAMALATLSPFCVYYAQEARTYALTLVLILASNLALLAWLGEGRARTLALYAAITLACLYTHYITLLLPATQGCCVWISRLDKRRRLQWLATLGAITAAFAPWPLHVWTHMAELVQPDTAMLIFTPMPPLQRAAHMLWTTLAEFSVGRTLSGLPALGGTLLFLFLVVLGATSADVTPQARRFLHCGLWLPVAALLILPRTAVYFSPKYLSVALPAFYLLAVAGLQRLRREAPWFFAVCLALGLLACAWGLGDWFLRIHDKVA